MTITLTGIFFMIYQPVAITSVFFSLRVISQLQFAIGVHELSASGNGYWSFLYKLSASGNLLLVFVSYQPVEITIGLFFMREQPAAICYCLRELSASGNLYRFMNYRSMAITTVFFFMSNQPVAITTDLFFMLTADPNYLCLYNNP